jgi:hypothetical protein
MNYPSLATNTYLYGIDSDNDDDNGIDDKIDDLLAPKYDIPSTAGSLLDDEVDDGSSEAHEGVDDELEGGRYARGGSI